MFQQCMLQQLHKTGNSSRELKRLYKIGRRLFTSKRDDVGTTDWLRRKQATLFGVNVKSSGQAAGELGHCIMASQGLVKPLIVAGVYRPPSKSRRLPN